MTFEWDADKQATNIASHGVDFDTAKQVFRDPRRVIQRDEKHSQAEPRLFCFGIVNGRVLTVRFTVRNGVVRIIGSGYWRKGKTIYEQANKKT